MKNEYWKKIEKRHDAKRSGASNALSKAAYKASSEAKKEENRFERSTSVGSDVQWERQGVEEAHKAAGEAHLAAAAVATGKARIEHLAKAAEHAEAAGGEWDESKHPRDENGKFS